MKILIPRAQGAVVPWPDWANNVDPAWWTAHNKVKHERHENFQRATLDACLGAMSGLMVLVLYLYHRQLFAFELDVSKLKMPSIERVPQTLADDVYVLPDELPRGES